MFFKPILQREMGDSYLGPNLSRVSVLTTKLSSQWQRIEFVAVFPVIVIDYMEVLQLKKQHCNHVYNKICYDNCIILPLHYI